MQGQRTASGFYTVEQVLYVPYILSKIKLRNDLILNKTSWTLCRLKVEFNDSSDADEFPFPVGSVDFWPAGSGSGTVFIGFGSYL